MGAGTLASCCGGQDEYDDTTLKSRENARALLDEQEHNKSAKHVSQSHKNKSLIAISDSSNHDDTPLLPNRYMVKQTFDLHQDLLTLKQEYKDTYKELLPRAFKTINDDLYRTYDDNNGVSIMQFNMLADGLSEAYSSIQSDKAFLGVDKECLQWKYRGVKICEEITRFNADIVCIQECDQIPFLMRYLESFGYSCYYHTIVDSPTQKVAKALSKERNESIQLPDYAIVILFKSDKFEINGNIQIIDRRENVERVSALAVPLKCRNNNKELLVITTHLKSKKSEKGEEIREKQIRLLLKTLIQNENNAAVILCCDLNGNPKKNKNGYEPLCYNTITNDIGYKSIYRLSNKDDAEPEYTTYKMRKHGIDKHTIDYIFVNDDNVWDIVSILTIPEISEALIPSFEYPSDHYSLMTQLMWKDRI